MWHNSLILGIFLFTLLNGSESRAVNISNKWTLPQEGFSVFYRFFRDKISWFEADAVCQFHHANLVTVDNSLQFDAARNFLQLLNITQPVWIGLMRPQNSKVFTWSNSKPLAPSSGYWAESLPLMDAPLCAVIDPVRDFRWHALRCGGPETASFLCEMNVPSWVKECIPHNVHSLTIEYVADTASVEIIKDCGDEESVQHSCRTHQDLNEILKGLLCKNEEYNGKKDMKYFKSLQFIKNISSDNNEDNNISTQPHKTEMKEKPMQKNQVQKLIEQFNIEEIMHADQPQEEHRPSLSPPSQPLPLLSDEIFKMPKKAEKKAKSIEKKNELIRKNRRSKLKISTTSSSLEDMMMGDQSLSSDVVVDETQKPLPHIKKSLHLDLKHDDQSTVAVPVTTLRSTTENTNKGFTTTTTTEVENFSTPTSTNAVSSVSISSPITENKIVGSIEHPMHLQEKQRGETTIGTTIIQENDGKHTLMAKDVTESHFIPPMLLVKSHYTSTKSHFDDQTNAVTTNKFDMTTTQSIPSISEKTIVQPSTISNFDRMTTLKKTTLSSISDDTKYDHDLLTTNSINANNKDQLKSNTIQTLSNSPATLATTTSDHQIAEIKILNPEDKLTVFSITTRPSGAVASSTTATILTENNSEIIEKQNAEVKQKQGQQQQQQQHIENNHRDHEFKNEFPTEGTTDDDLTMISSSSSILHQQQQQQQQQNYQDKRNYSDQQSKKKPINKFSNEENFQPYKPNRRRILTKPETTTYLKKILG